MGGLPSSDQAAGRYRSERAAYWDRVATGVVRSRGWGKHYHRRLREIYTSLIPPGSRVLELGCGQGNLLAALKPSSGVGVDFCPQMIESAKKLHPELRFELADTHDLELRETFDYVVLSDLLSDLWDVQTVLERILAACDSRTRIVLNFYSRVWEPLLAAAQRLGFARPTLRGNWLSIHDLANLLHLADFEVIRSWQEVLFPLGVPWIEALCNRFLVRVFPFFHLALTNFAVARPLMSPVVGMQPSVSVVIPARNEAGNIREIFARMPEMGSEFELVFVEGHSEDQTYETIAAEVAEHPQWHCTLVRQEGMGKGDAVRQGFAHARGDVLMILDADLAVAPEALPRFLEALVAGKGELVNGVRLVYPMERTAMRFLNLVGNKFFTIAFTWILGQPIKDALCGTKVLWRRDYEMLAANRHSLGDFDPFGDFDLIFGCAKLNRRIVDMPVRYRERQYGETNIRRWQHGWMLLKMLILGTLKLKFI